MSRLFAIAAMSIGLAGCAAGPPVNAVSSVPPSPPPAEMVEPITLTPAQRKAVQTGLKTRLKDPDSARFGEFKAGRDGKGEITVCGYVNAKNSYGGYTGQKPFLGVLSQGSNHFVVAGIGGTDIETLSVQQVCARAGLTI